MTNNNPTQLLGAVCRRGVLCAVSVRYWRGCKQLKAEDLGIDPAHIDERLIRLGHKRLVPRDALEPFALTESRARSLVEGASFPFLGGIARFVPNPRLESLREGLEQLRARFSDDVLAFVGNYESLRRSAMAEWREAAAHLNLNGDTERLLETIEQSFPLGGEIARRFGFETRYFQVAAPESLRVEVSDSLEQLEVADERRRVAEEAGRRLQADLDGFIRESVTAMRGETARLCTEVLDTIDNSPVAVHQRTLDRLSSFIERFRSLNFAQDTQLEATLEKFRKDLLTRNAEELRNDRAALGNLTDGLQRLRESAVRLAQSDARDIVSRFGQLGGRRLAMAG